MSESDEVIAGRYRLLQRVGTGGMGAVWRAHDERLGRDVAVKRLHTRWGVDPAEAEVASQRAMREARITARLHHPHAVPVFDVVEHEGQPCLVMQYFPSNSLAELTAAEPGPSATDVARIGGDVASALAAAHELGIVHRDVKPANVLVAADGTAKISDFGIAHALGDVSLTSTGLVTGTPAYLAPEVAQGEESTPASDVFSLGSTLYTVLEGRPPFGTHENSMALLHRVASGEVEPPRRSGALTDLLVRMLAPRPEDRPTMTEVARSLRQPGSDGVASGPGAAHEVEGEDAAVLAVPAAPVGEDLLWEFRDQPPTDPGPPSGVRTDRHRRRALVAVLALTAAVAAVVLGVAAQQDDDPSAAPPAGSDTGRATAAASPGPSTAAPTRAAPTSSRPAPSTTAPRPSTTPTRSSPATPTTAGGAPTTAELRAAVQDYYALLPADRDAGWELLTDRYQRTTARNRATYDSFWESVDRVRVSDVTASAPGSVTATLMYDFDDGREFVERTSYRLVPEDGVLKIDRSTVLSSVQR
ncbi:MAG TPA: protein kinase [Ornithinibacter sp.]|nr:protein kinase [Ornithinibacter sp.]